MSHDQMSTESVTLWEPQPQAAELIGELVREATARVPWLAAWQQRLLATTGTRLVDWVDHVAIPADHWGGAWETTILRLQDAGYQVGGVATDALPEPRAGEVVHWRTDQALLPPVECLRETPLRLALKVESVADFLAAQGMGGAVQPIGGPSASVRKACVAKAGHGSVGGEVWVVERHGDRGWQPTELTPTEIMLLWEHADRFRRRPRHGEDDAEGFAAASRLIDAATADLGVDRACDLFFAAERRYWQDRNRAAQVQRGRQDRLGLGWANHDHHTYRSSRQHFADLIRVLEELGFECRERFYAGEQAGWGAQVLEHPVCGIVIFADVDLSPDEIMGDFAHAGLPPHRELGTVGLWCQLHGEAFLQAGMHHLECQFDFAAARQQLEAEGVASMPPFTDFEYLKQSFTEGEVWPVDESRLQRAIEEGYVTESQAERFRREGALGSHLEVLERNDGYKGFNQTGISDIIRKTDPRTQLS